MLKKLLLVGWAVLLIVSCGDSNPSKVLDPVPMSTKKELGLKVAKGFETGDSDLLQQCVTADEGCRRVMAVWLKAYVAGREFVSMFDKEYGAGAWLKAGGKDGSNGMKLSKISLAEATQNYDNWNMGDSNVIKIGITNSSFPVKKVEGGWILDFKVLAPDEAQLEKIVGMMEDATQLLERHKKAIGHPDLDAQKINSQMGSEFLKIMGMAIPTEQIYDVDSL